MLSLYPSSYEITDRGRIRAFLEVKLWSQHMVDIWLKLACRSRFSSSHRPTASTAYPFRHKLQVSPESHEPFCQMHLSASLSSSSPQPREREKHRGTWRGGGGGKTWVCAWFPFPTATSFSSFSWKNSYQEHAPSKCLAMINACLNKNTLPQSCISSPREEVAAIYYAGLFVVGTF